MPQASVTAAVILLGVTVVSILCYMFGNNQQDRPHQYNEFYTYTATQERWDDDDCVICHQPLSESGTRTLPCKHEFHRNCVEEWKRISGVTYAPCPLCRAEYT